MRSRSKHVRADRAPGDRRPSAWALVAVILALTVGSLSMIATGARAAAPSTSRIYFYGDSLLVEAANYIYPALNSATTTIRINAISGTALCDWVYPHYQVRSQRFVPGGILQLSAATAPRVAVLQFSGNDFTPCVAPDAGAPSRIVANYSMMLKACLLYTSDAADE